MAKKKAASTVDWLKPKFEGKSYHFAGRFDRYSPHDRETLERVVRTLGGTLADKLDSSVSFLVLAKPTGSSSHEQKVAKLNTKGASIQVVEPESLLRELIPSQDEYFALVTTGEVGRKMLTERFSFKDYQPLRGLRFQTPSTSLKGLNLDDVPLSWIALEGADLRQTSVTRPDDGLIEVGLGDLVQVQLDAADLCVNFSSLTDCSCRKARFDGSRVFDSFGPKVNFTGDFTATSMVRMSFTRAILSKSKFEKVDFSHASFERIVASDAKFDAASFQAADCHASIFKGSSFARTNFTNAVITDCDLSNCDLTSADFTGAVLTDVSFVDANLTGANFTNAIVVRTKFDGANLAKVTHLEIGTDRPIGPALRELSDLARQANQLSISITAKSRRGPVVLEVKMNRWSGITASWKIDDADRKSATKSIADAISQLATTWAHSEPQLFSIICEGDKVGVTKKRLQELCLAAWCESFGVPIPTAEDQNALRAEAASEATQLRDQLIADLKANDRGVRWNKRSTAELDRVSPFEKVDLSGHDLSDMSFRRVEFVDSDFKNATFAKGMVVAMFARCDFARADFSEANLRSAKFRECSMQRADFAKAQAELVQFANCDLQSASFQDAALDQANLKGANLAKSNLGTSGASLKKTEFDEHTIFPKGFVIPDSMAWKGTGVDPRQQAAVAAIQAAGKMDVAQFMTLLEASVDKDRIKKATSMLKAERFRLFAQAADDHLVGVVKSQSDPDLVYSCRLTKEGEFSCCTQNLNVCGGLRGALCKHLLVLIIGMTNGGELDPNVVNQWITASRFKKPALDKDAMSETLLRYKGAEAGEVDWRPMETIPEDYYAL